MGSILDSDEEGKCYMCGRYGATEKHHIFGGANRKLSEEDGLYIHLCHNCHNEPPDGVHFNRERRRWLQRVGQQAYEISRWRKGCSLEAAHEGFVRRYGRNYL